jgi:hypothetical protein
LLYAFIPTISRAYRIFTAMPTQVYLIMYVLMFIAALCPRRAQPAHPRGYRAPGLGMLCVLRRGVVGDCVVDRIRAAVTARTPEPGPVRGSDPGWPARHTVARFDQVTDVSDADRDLAFANIEKAAQHYGVHLSETDWHQLGGYRQPDR